MAKLKNPLLGFDIKGSLSHIVSFRGRGKKTIVEKIPLPTDIKSPAQLSWRHMYQKAAALWHLLSADEKADWETGARIRHMTGYAWFMSQCLKPNPGIYLPLQGGSMQGDIDMADHKITDLPAPALDQEAATKKYVDDAGGAAPHAATHETTGADEISIAALLGEPAALTTHKALTTGVHGVGARHIAETTVQDLDLAAHKTRHQVGGADELFASKARAYVSAPWNLANNTWVKVALNVENYDGLGEFDSAANYRFTAQAAGYYLLIAKTQCNGNSVDGQYVGIAVYLNGVRYSDIYMNAAGANKFTPAQFVDLISLAAGNFLEMYAWQTSGALQQMSGGSPATYLVVSRVS